MANLVIHKKPNRILTKKCLGTKELTPCDDNDIDTIDKNSLIRKIIVLPRNIYQALEYATSEDEIYCASMDWESDVHYDIQYEELNNMSQSSDRYKHYQATQDY